MQRCSNCGHDNKDDANFCERCGNALGASCPKCGTVNDPDAKFCRSCATPLGSGKAKSAERPLPAAFGGGRYRVEGFLGEGGRKKVYLARDTSLDRQVAIAEIKTQDLDESGIQRVRQEAQAMARLGDHPSIVTVFDIFDESRSVLMVTQYMAGGSVEDLMQQGQALDVDRAIQIGDDIAAALEHAHAHGIIHRDVKPGNVWLSADGRAKLGDFGLAAANDRPRLTVEGMMVGTAAYMSPEQATGKPSEARSDLYSLGITLYEMLTGKPPFMGDDIVAVISQHITTAPVAPSWQNPRVSMPLEQLVLELLAKTPAERPATATDVRARLAEVKEVKPTTSQITAAVRDVNPLDKLAGGVFVGRDREQAELRKAFEEVMAGTPQLIMLVGEPGIGKTRAAEELATYAKLKGAEILLGRCYEGEGAPPYWPWIQIVRAYLGDRSPQELLKLMGAGAPDIAQVVSEVRERLPGLPEPVPLDADQARFRFFQSIATFFKNASAEHPLLVILDDLHWADKPTLLLLRFLVREVREARILGIGTYRDIELGRHHPLAQTMAELSRENATRRVLLRGLTEQDVERFIELTVGTKPRKDLAAAVYRETEGNPFFMTETVRLLAQEGRFEEGATKEQSISLTIPQGVREVIGRRLNQLSESSNAVLSIASVMGRDFALSALERVSDLDKESILDALEEALDARLIMESQDGIGRYRFSHALVKETLYDELSTTRRIRMHLKIGHVIEELHASDIERHYSELAHHFFEAAAAGEIDKAVKYLVAAAERARGSYAWEEAVDHYDKALQALEQAEVIDHARMGEVSLALAQSQITSGDGKAAEVTLDKTSAIARKLNSHDLLARAALSLGDVLVSAGWAEKKLIDTLEEAIAAMPEEDSSLRARLLARMGEAIRFTDRRSEELTYSEQAIEMARRIGDDATLAPVLFARAVALGAPETMEQRLEVINELIEVAHRAGDVQRELLGWRIKVATQEAGSFAGAREAIDRYTELAEKIRQPLYTWFIPLMRALVGMVEGRFEDAERELEEAWRQGSEANEPNLAAFTWAIRFQLLMARGMDERAADAALAQLEDFRWAIWSRSGSMIINALLGRHDVARTIAAEVYEDSKISRDWGLLWAMADIIETAQILGEADKAAYAYERLEPFRDRFLIGGVFVVRGPATHYLAIAKRLLGDLDAAIEFSREAIQAAERFGSPPMVARARYELARELLLRNQGSDEDEALREANEALDSARRMGMNTLVENLLSLKLTLQKVEPSETMTSIHAVADRVADEKPDLSTYASPEGILTIMFSDIENSTPLTTQLGDTRWLEVLRQHNDIISDLVTRHGGNVVKTQGDGFMVTFSSARSGLRSAIEIQKSLAKFAETITEVPIRVRIGLHTGEVLKEGSDFFGHHVNVAARVSSQAKGGQIVVSSITKELVTGAGDFTFSDPWDVELKGVGGTQKIFEVLY